MHMSTAHNYKSPVLLGKAYMRRKKTVGPGRRASGLLRLRRRSAHWRHVNVKVPSTEGRSAGATPQHATLIDQWPSCDGGKSFPLVLHKGTIGEGWPNLVATEGVLITVG